MKNNKIIIPELDIVIILANGAGLKKIPILLDTDGFEKLDDLVKGTFYVNVSKRTAYAFFAKQSGQIRTINSMHRLLTDCPNHLVVDHHPNHYGLDNRSENLTVVTPEINLANAHKEKDRPILFESLSNLDDLDAIKRDIQTIKRFRVKK